VIFRVLRIVSFQKKTVSLDLDEEKADNSERSLVYLLYPTTYIGTVLLLLYCSFLQALGRNSYVRVLEMDLSSIIPTDGIVSFLDGAPALEKVTLSYCNAEGGIIDDEASTNISNSAKIAAAFQRNNRVQFPSLFSCQSPLARSIFQSLAAPACASTLIHLEYAAPWDDDDEGRTSIAEALKQYLESPKVTVQQLKLSYLHFKRPPGAFRILEGLRRNTSVNQLAFHCCRIGGRYHSVDFWEGDDDEEKGDDDDDDDGEEGDNESRAQELANLIQNKPGLESLRICSSNILCNTRQFLQPLRNYW